MVAVSLFVEACASIRLPFLHEICSKAMRKYLASQPVFTSYKLLEIERQRLAAWTTKAYTDDNLFLTLARSPGVLEMFLHWAAFLYTGVSRLDPSTMELCRIRLAARNHCVH